MSDLDRPVWASLQQRTHWGLGDDRARRFQPDIHLFAATPDEHPDSLAALSKLVRPGGDSVYLLQVPAIVVPPGLEAAKAASGFRWLRHASCMWTRRSKCWARPTRPRCSPWPN